MTRLKNFLKVLTLGGLAGFIGGLLFAPAKGDETRSKVKEAVEKGKQKFDELKKEFGKKAE